MLIDLGCGWDKKPGYYGIDIQPLPGVDLVWDCNEKIPLDDSVAHAIFASNFLEHINNNKRIHIMTEIWRLLKPGGVLTAYVPSCNGPHAFQDPTHYSYWNEISFYYYVNDEYRKMYCIIPRFDIITLKTHTTQRDMKAGTVEAVLKAVKPYPIGGSYV